MSKKVKGGVIETTSKRYTHPQTIPENVSRSVYGNGYS
jgi:hypothetical protein